MKITNTAVDRPVATLVLALAVIVLGIYGLAHLPINLLPDITYPMIKVNVRWPGATPEDVEQNIADIIERKMATVDDLDYLDSRCFEGMYQLLINFAYGADVDVAYEDVTAKMGTVRDLLPKDADAPIIIKADPSQLSTVDIAILSDTTNLVSLRTWVENYLQDQFAAVAGTAGTEVTGGLEREIRVHVDPAAVQARGLTFEQIANAIAAENVESLGGWVTGEKKEHVARTVAEYQNLDDLRHVIVTTDATGQPVFLGDVAKIIDFHELQRVVTDLNGQECVKLSVFKQSAANTVEVAKGVRAKIAELRELAPPGVRMRVIFDASDYIIRAAAGASHTALIAAVLVVLVTAFFLAGWQRVIVVVITLPVSLLAAFFVANLLNFSINIFSLGGLVVAITVLLDNCVVVMENITRLQVEHPDEPHPVRVGTAEVGGAVAGATLTFVAIFAPFLMVPGLSSLFFRELIVIVAVTIIASLLVALTLTPCLMNLFFPEGAPVGHRRGAVAKLADRILHAMRRAYRPLLGYCLQRPWLVVVAAVALLLVGIVMLRFVGSEFLPKVDDGYIVAKLKMPTGTAVAETDRVLARIEKALDDVPYVKQKFRLSGGRIWGLVTYEIPQEGEVDVELVPPRERPLTTDQWVDKYGPRIAKAAMVPGARIKVMHMKMRGIRKIGEYDVEVELRAPRTESVEGLAQAASRVKGALKDVRGLAKLDVSLDVSKPEYQVVIDRPRAADLGITAANVARTVRTLIDGIVPSQFHEGGYYYDIRIRQQEGTVWDRGAMEQIVLPAPNGRTCLLSDVAQIVPTVGPTEIDRYDQMRMIKVTADASGISPGEANARVGRALKDVELPPGYQMQFGATAREMRQNFRSLGLILALAMFFAYVVLAILFESFSLPFVILIRVPLSLIGISLALFLTGTPAGATVMIGAVILAGIEINHGVVLLGYVRELQARGSAPRDAIVDGAMVRLRPVLMTLLVGIVGLLPLALGIEEGSELLKPMAIAVIGGLVFSLLLTFLFMPALYFIFARRARR